VRVWRETDPNAKPDQKPTSAELTQIEEDLVNNKIKPTVARLFPKELAEFALDNVNVTVFQTLTPDPVMEPPVASRAMAWAGRNSNSLVMVGLAMMSLAMLRSMMKSIPPADRTVTFAEPAFPETSEAPQRAAKPAEEAAKKEPGRPKLRLKKGPTLKDDLIEMVKEDPDGAAAILKTWIGNAA
jgi:flagellar M-ring protein FliF